MALKQKLTDAKIRALKPDPARAYTTADGGGLYLMVTRQGGKLWRLAYRLNGNQRHLAIGEWPVVSLAMARDAMIEAKRLIRDGVDPCAAKQEEKTAKKKASETRGLTFDALAERYFATPKVAAGARRQSDKLDWLKRLIACSEHVIGKDAKDVTHADLAAAVAGIAARGKLSSAIEAAQLANRVGAWGVRQGLITHNPAVGLRADLPRPPEPTPRAAVHDIDQVATVLRALDTVEGSAGLVNAVKLSPYLVLRTGELVALTWEMCDLDTAMITLPGEIMKMGKPHVVPLAPQVVEMLRGIREKTSGKWVFPSARLRDAALGGGAVRVAYKDVLRETGIAFVPHGWRSVFSSHFNRLGYNSDAIEKQLAHQEANAVRRAYDRDDRIEQRTELMRLWADYLDGLRAS